MGWNTEEYYVFCASVQFLMPRFQVAFWPVKTLFHKNTTETMRYKDHGFAFDLSLQLQRRILVILGDIVLACVFKKTGGYVGIIIVGQHSCIWNFPRSKSLGQQVTTAESLPNAFPVMTGDLHRSRLCHPEKISNGIFLLPFRGSAKVLFSPMSYSGGREDHEQIWCCGMKWLSI